MPLSAFQPAGTLENSDKCDTIIRFRLVFIIVVNDEITFLSV